MTEAILGRRCPHWTNGCHSVNRDEEGFINVRTGEWSETAQWGGAGSITACGKCGKRWRWTKNGSWVEEEPQ